MHGRIKVSCKNLRNTIKKSEAWKKAKYIEIQSSTDRDFLKNVKTKRIRKGTFNKAKAKSTLYRLKRGKTYYVRVRLVDKKGVCSNWSRAAEIKTKK